MGDFNTQLQHLTRKNTLIWTKGWCKRWYIMVSIVFDQMKHCLIGVSFAAQSLLDHTTMALSMMPRSSQITMAVSGHTSKVRKHIAKAITTAEKLNSQVKQSQSQVTHSMPPEKIEIFKSMDGWAKNNLLKYLKPVEDSWQPQDFLPEPRSEQFFDQIKEIRERAAEIPDEYYVCLVGDMITEEALPSYQTYINGNDGVEDETGFSMDAWAVWSRAWTSEENRHGDLLNKYLYLSGRVDMRQVEKTIQYLIRDGIDLRSENNPYLFFVYTSFQERATFISHANTARLAKGYGDINLAKICGTIASDEKRHEGAYTKIVEKLFELDPDYMMLQLEKMMRKKIAMPGRFMTDGKDPNLFDNYASVAQRIGVYTAKDYVDIVEFLVGVWRVDQIRDGLSGEGRRAQDYVCGLASRMRTVEERARERGKKNAEILVPFSWIFNKEIRV